MVTHNFCDPSTFVSAPDSNFEVKPPQGKIYTIGKSEVQFLHDLQISTVTKLIIDYYVWYNHPEYGQIEVVGESIEFDHIKKIFELGNSHYTTGAIGTEMPYPITTVQFNYRKALVLRGDFMEMELSKIVFRLDNDVPAGGTYATCGLVIEESNS